MECAWVRGGTSKGLFFNSDRFPYAQHSKERDEVVRRCLGFGGNGLQLDGVGGGISSTSKVAFVGTKLAPEGFDLTYDFGQVSNMTGEIDWKGNCGNLASAVLCFAQSEALLNNKKKARVWQMNVRQEMNVSQLGYDITLAGLNFPSEAVLVEFAGDVTRTVLPTGNPVDLICDKVPATLVLGSNPTVFVDSKHLLSSTRETQQQAEWIETLRQGGALKMKVPCNDAVRVCFLSPTSSSGADVFAQITVPPNGGGRLFHHAITGTGAANLAIASQIPHTICHHYHNTPELTIAHASGQMKIGAKTKFTPQHGWCSLGVQFLRTARILLKGKVYY